MERGGDSINFNVSQEEMVEGYCCYLGNRHFKVFLSDVYTLLSLRVYIPHTPCGTMEVTVHVLQKIAESAIGSRT